MRARRARGRARPAAPASRGRAPRPLLTVSPAPRAPPLPRAPGNSKTSRKNSSRSAPFSTEGEGAHTTERRQESRERLRLQVCRF
eukprot:scaffold52343_cov56-Phaeocystis_antarctica.AAC.6